MRWGWCHNWGVRCPFCVVASSPSTPIPPPRSCTGEEQAVYPLSIGRCVGATGGESLAQSERKNGGVFGARSNAGSGDKHNHRHAQPTHSAFALSPANAPGQHTQRSRTYPVHTPSQHTQRSRTYPVNTPSQHTQRSRTYPVHTPSQRTQPTLPALAYISTRLELAYNQH
jgi:hypothetical protein